MKCDRLRKRRTIFLFAFFLFFSIAFFPAEAAIPQKMNYQGYLSDSGGAPVNGTVQMVFSIYNEGGTLLWSETRSVPVASGVYSVDLGEVTPLTLTFDIPYYLGIRVGTDAEMNPRIPLASAGYAFRAQTVDMIGAHNHSGADITSGIIAEARIDPSIARDAEVGSLISAHAANASAHHPRYTDSEAVAAIKAADGSGSGLDADLLDGLHSTAFAIAAHNHDGTYVRTTGDSMSGSSSSPILSVSNTATTATAFGVYGSTASNANGVAGVRGSAGLPGTTIAGKHGVLGQSDTGKGVVGVSRDSYGTYGWSTNTWGLRGEGVNGGVYGLSSNSGSTAIRGENIAATGWSYGVYGESDSTDGGAAVRGDGAYVGVWGESSGKWGVYAKSTGTSSSYGIYATVGAGTGNYAGYFLGPVHVTGQLTKGSGAFKIDHPLDPKNKYLYHSFVESPDMMNVYNGNVVLDGAGTAWVELPDWFEALNRDFRYQLTSIGGPGPNLHIAQKILNNRFQIAGGAPGLEVSWQVTGVRQDPYAEANRVPVEEEKLPDEKGTYLHPSAYGQSEEATPGSLNRTALWGGPAGGLRTGPEISRKPAPSSRSNQD